MADMNGAAAEMRRHSSLVAAGPAVLIHTATWALLLPEVARWNAAMNPYWKEQR